MAMGAAGSGEGNGRAAGARATRPLLPPSPLDVRDAAARAAARAPPQRRWVRIYSRRRAQLVGRSLCGGARRGQRLGPAWGPEQEAVRSAGAWPGFCAWAVFTGVLWSGAGA
jgi:hypothetical protein